MNSTQENTGKEFKAKLLDVFRFTINFLNQHNLRWFVGFGTCIGAIRHKGMIPWDDDIDLFMPREDYNKLLSLNDDFKGTGFELSSWANGNSTLPFAKIIDKNTTLWEFKEIPSIIGVFIDIFPMDLSSEKDGLVIKELKKFDKCLKKYRYSISQYTLSGAISSMRKYGLKNGLHQLGSLFLSPLQKYYFNKLQSLDKKHFCTDGERYVLYSACFAYKYEKEILKREWFDDYVIMPFEGIEVRVPIGYDNYLRHVYGDYMQLPPESERVSRHYHYYVDLKMRKSISEIISEKN